MISIKVRIRWPNRGGAGDLDSTLRVSGVMKLTETEGGVQGNEF